MHKYHNELTNIVGKLEDLLNEVKAVPPEMAVVSQRITNKVTVERNFINGLLGVSATVTDNVAAPLTHIMGVPITRPEPVTADVITPTNDEATKFLSDRDNLYRNFLNLSDKQLWDKHRMPMGEPLIRACAKKAGVDNYADAKINVVFFGAIRANIKAEAELAVSLKEAADNLANAQ